MQASPLSYSLLDSGEFRKLEQVGEFRIVRPAPTAVWDRHLPESEWKADAEFVRARDGGGEWKIRNNHLEKPFAIAIEQNQVVIKLTSFGHLGIFAEQLENWKLYDSLIAEQVAAGTKPKVLNLFGYTGIATLFCLRAGAEVAHVDASKGTVKWASENAKLSGLEDRPARWLVDDVKEFVARDLRREARYHAIILDPPSYGKGEKRQVWKIEEDLMPLLKQLSQMLVPEGPAFVCLSAHSEGYTPTSLSNQLASTFGPGQLTSGEMLIWDKNRRALPSGASALWRRS